MDVTVDGLKTHAATGGREAQDGEPVVILIHGAGLDRTAWQLQTRNIAHKGRRALAVDLPGHGRSAGEPLATIEAMAAWLGRFMDAAGIDKATLIGHSMGAFVALEATVRHPGRVERLVVMGIADTMPVHPELLAAAGLGKPLAPELIVFWGLSDKARAGGHPGPGLWVPGATKTLLNLSRPGVLGSDLVACNSYDGGTKAAARVTCPVLFLLGREDKMTPARKGEALAKTVANARTVVIEDCGHMMMSERPHHVHDALKGFVF